MSVGTPLVSPLVYVARTTANQHSGMDFQEKIDTAKLNLKTTCCIIEMFLYPLLLRKYLIETIRFKTSIKIDLRLREASPDGDSCTDNIAHIIRA
ncbi:hypothetical protein SISSUDRAFT_1068082 [Sistotremastrum suecicum HHB10207 ss-3]|uniref:Uncharacterized protein n=1 Tax=Sistotremastrum suecicum HHB10207 ss-3 TaxID=1314776 RepID=A0A165WG47_9AGAM|nr:hypothetical protein SISSUDRAFT_1068082 [Sistotremastrum suecicum HHB10207 ss-3]